MHSERGRGQLVDFGLAPEKVRVIGHPVFRSEIDRRDDGRTALCLGLIRPYKGTEDAVQAVLGVDDARLLVVGDPRVPVDGLMQTAGERAEWRLGYLPDAELRRALSEATVGLFPYREEIDVSGALLQLLGAGVPAIVYDIGGLGEVVRRFGAGAVVARRRRRGDVRRTAADDRRAARARRRAGRRRARSRGAHVGRLGCRSPRPVPGACVIFRRGRFHELVERQLDLFADETELLDEAREADAAWSSAAADESEELYGDYQLVVDAIGERLYDLRETYAATLDRTRPPSTALRSTGPRRSGSAGSRPFWRRTR